MTAKNQAPSNEPHAWPHYTSSLTPLPSRDNHNCFGCSPRNNVGLQMQFHAGEKELYSFLTVPDHLGGWNQIVHGGVVSTIMDEIMAWSAIYFTGLMVMTKSMSIDFLHPIQLHTPITAKGFVKERLNKREAIVQGEIFNSDNQLCARATGHFALFTQNAVVRLGIMDKQTVDDFLSFLSQTKRPD